MCDLIIFQRTFRPSNQKQEAENASVEDYQSQLVKDVQPFKPALVAVQKRYGARMDCSLAAPKAASTSGAESWALAV